ncbi:hypothetical protein LTR53_003932 [Teratosphaeriaceae sp. CCFEE 6253]|nr:hypothetical protein LTR53_003932 [Teratosphaeriaceae sp. CCFEE 6253]
MGSDQSKLTDEQRATIEAETISRIDAHVARLKPEHDKWAAELKQAYQERDAAEEQRTRELDAVAVAEKTHALKKPGLLRYSKGGAVQPPATMDSAMMDVSELPPIMADIDATNDPDDPETATADDEEIFEEGEISDDALKDWQPRKAPFAKASSGVVQSHDGPSHQASVKDTERRTQVSATAKDGEKRVGRAKSKLPSAALDVRVSRDEGKQQATSLPAEVVAKKPAGPPTISTSANAISDQVPGSATTSATAPVTTTAKRPVTSAFVDDCRSSIQKSSKRGVFASPRSPDGGAPSTSKSQVPKKSEIPSRTKIEERPPTWYTNLKNGARKADEGNAWSLFQRLKGDIKRCKDPKSATPAPVIFDDIRAALHKLAFEQVSGQLLRNTRMLHDQDGLPQIFDQRFGDGVSFPWDLRADAEELYNKWCERDFETDLLRGIIRGKAKKAGAEERTVDSLDPKYTGRRSAKFHGNGLLLNGQWWPTQLTAVRDGCHGATIAGISGAAGEGAYSCIMSGGHDYPDEDFGKEVLYCGTDSTDGLVTEPTQRMLESEKNGKPVRLIRSHNLGSVYRPDIGFRYDGLYTVVGHKNMDGAASTRQRHQFNLVRMPGQAEIRGTGPAKRPTEQEIKAHTDDKRLRGYT